MRWMRSKFQSVFLCYFAQALSSIHILPITITQLMAPESMSLSTRIFRGANGRPFNLPVTHSVLSNVSFLDNYSLRYSLPRLLKDVDLTAYKALGITINLGKHREHPRFIIVCSLGFESSAIISDSTLSLVENAHYVPRLASFTGVKINTSGRPVSRPFIVVDVLA